jgi:hypothetical protein
MNLVALDHERLTSSITKWESHKERECARVNSASATFRREPEDHLTSVVRVGRALHESGFLQCRKRSSHGLWFYGFGALPPCE